MSTRTVLVVLVGVAACTRPDAVGTGEPVGATAGAGSSSTSVPTRTPPATPTSTPTPTPTPMPDPFAPDDEAAVRKAWKEATGHDPGEDGCYEWSTTFPRIVAVGGFASDRGCDLEGIFVDRKFFATGGEVPGLATKGFAGSGIDDKERLARAWVDEVLQAFGGRFVTEPQPAFGLPDTPKFDPVRSTANKIGGVVVSGWVAQPPGMVFESAYSFVTYRFAPDGAVTIEAGRSFSVPGERLRELESKTK